MEVILSRLLLAGELSSMYLLLLSSIRNTKQPKRMACRNLSLMQSCNRLLRLNTETILKSYKGCLFLNSLSPILIRHLMKCSDCLRKICLTQRRYCLSLISVATLTDLNATTLTSYNLEQIRHSKKKYQLLTKSY